LTVFGIFRRHIVRSYEVSSDRNAMGASVTGGTVLGDGCGGEERISGGMLGRFKGGRKGVKGIGGGRLTKDRERTIEFRLRDALVLTRRLRGGTLMV